MTRENKENEMSGENKMPRLTTWSGSPAARLSDKLIMTALENLTDVDGTAPTDDEIQTALVKALIHVIDGPSSTVSRVCLTLEKREDEAIVRTELVMTRLEPIAE